MDIRMHRLFQYCTSEAEIFKVHILREIVLIQAVGYELIGKHRRGILIYDLYGIDIGFITCHYPYIPIGLPVLGFY
jgi:hypothetical protein